jgi:hypothetical protein
MNNPEMTTAMTENIPHVQLFDALSFLPTARIEQQIMTARLYQTAFLGLR